MGKKSKQNGAANYPVVKEQHIQPVNNYFMGKTVKEQKQLDQNIAYKVADDNSEMEAEASFSTKDDLKALENALVEKIAALLQPIQKQLSTINATLNEMKKTADLALTNQDTSRVLQYEQERTKKLLGLEIDAKAYNIKIRGMPEQAETTCKFLY